MRIYKVRDASGKVIGEVFRPALQPKTYGFCLRMSGVLWSPENEPARSGYSVGRFATKREAVAKARAIRPALV